MYNAITWLAGRVFIERGFAEKLNEGGVDAVDCPFDDLTDDQRAVIEAAAQVPELMDVVDDWWVAYDTARLRGEVPEARAPWLD